MQVNANRQSKANPYVTLFHSNYKKINLTFASHTAIYLICNLLSMKCKKHIDNNKLCKVSKGQKVFHTKVWKRNLKE